MELRPAPRLLVTRERRHVGLQVLTSRAWAKPKQISGNFAKTFSSLFWSFAGFGIRKLPFAGVDKAIGLNPGLAREELKTPPRVVEYLRVSSALDDDAIFEH